ncbi:LysR family transcriptional regulator, partial [Klebsiella oxytoca]|nr:LysR family transcriptional regulator [Klebsiella oxytoca]
MQDLADTVSFHNGLSFAVALRRGSFLLEGVYDVRLFR